MANRGFFSQSYTRKLVNKRNDQFIDNIESDSSENEECEDQMVLENVIQSVVSPNDEIVDAVYGERDGKPMMMICHLALTKN